MLPRTWQAEIDWLRNREYIHALMLSLGLYKHLAKPCNLQTSLFLPCHAIIPEAVLYSLVSLAQITYTRQGD